MFFRRTLNHGTLVHQKRDASGTWQPLDASPLGPSPFSEAYETEVAGRHPRASVLPFQPLSFRDFLLYEQHNIDASRGLVERFHPGQHRAATTIERLTRKPFPKFRPHRLFHAQPIYYFGNHSTFLPSGADVDFPRYSEALDFELELGFVLARPLRDASPEEAVAAIGAFCVLNDFSARDVQRTEMASGFGPQKSKHFASSLSDVAATADEVLPRLDELIGRVLIDGEVVSEVSSAGMRWSLGEVLAHASRSETLQPYELFGTGTLPGGSGMETGHWLTSGQTLRLELDGLGQVEHRIV